MPSQWSFITLILAAAVITLVSLAGVRIAGSYSRVISQDRQRREVFLVGLMAGFVVWPLSLLLALRLWDSFREWVTVGPFPVHLLTDPPYMVGFSALSVGGPFAIILLLDRLRRR